MNWNELVVLAVGVLISPIPIVAIILTMMSQRGIANGIGFFSGWLIAIILVSGGGAILWQRIERSSQSVELVEDGSSVVWLIFGLILLALSIRLGWQYIKRDRNQPKIPLWLQMIESFGPVKAGVFGFILTIVNVKNLPLTIEAAGILSRTEGEMVSFIGGLVLFVVIASTGVAVPLVAAYIGNRAAEEQLQRWKRWLQHHNTLILCVLFFVLAIRAMIRG